MTDKFKSLVHYICDKTSVKGIKFGLQKLNKVLYFLDFMNYLVNGESISGSTYIKCQFGPVPLTILATLKELQEEGKIIIEDKNIRGYSTRQYTSHKAPNIECFNADQISIVDSILGEILENHTAESISIASHDHIWEAAEIGEEIPYYTVYASQLAEVNEDDIEWGMRVAE